MRARTSGENTILAAAQKAVSAVKVEIKDAGGSYVDWFDYLLSVQWGASIDQPIVEVRLALKRDNGLANSLSPFRGDSSLNIGGAAVDVGRDIRISPATTAWASAPVSGDYKLLFQGKTADIDFANAAMEVVARDQGGTLVRLQIKEASEFRSEAGEPLEDVIQALLDDWAPGVTLYTPSSPGFNVTSIDWAKGSLFEAIRTAAGSIGWDVRYLWDDGTSTFRLTLFEPDRAKTTPDWTFAKNRYFNISTLAIRSEYVRNSIQVSYLNAATGNRETVTAEDATSITRFGEQWMEIEEADSSPINTEAEAQALADAALADLAWPIAEKQVEIPFFWPVELGDLIRFTANDVHSDEDIDLAVTGFAHRLDRNGARTTLTLRGKPAGFYRDWIRRSKQGITPTTEARGLIDFREISRTETHITYGWTRGSLVDAVFVYDNLVTEPLADDPWPTANTLPTVILATENEYETEIPKAGKVRVLQFEPRDTALVPGPVRRALVHAPPAVVAAVLDAVENGDVVDLTLTVRATASAYPVIATVYEDEKDGAVLAIWTFTEDGEIDKTDDADLGDRAPAINEKRFWYAKLVDVVGTEYWVQDSIAPREKPIVGEVLQLPGDSKEYVDLYVTVSDPLNRGGTLRAWLDRTSPDSPDPTAAAEWTIEVPSTPATIDPADDWTPLGGGATANALDEVRIHGGNGKQVFFQFVLANGVESAIQAVTLKTWLEIIDDEGELSSGAIKHASQFAADIPPVHVVAALPTLPDADYPQGRMVFLTTDNKLYRSTGSTWTAAVAAVDLSGQITNTQISDNAISTPKLQANAVTATKIGANEIQSTHILANSIIAGKIAAGAINSDTLFVAGVVTSGAIATGAVIADKIAAGAIIASKIAAGVITADKMASLTGGGLTIDFSASGSSPVLDHAAFELLANGNATFSGALSAASGTFAGALSAATGTFAGTISAGAVVATDSFTAASMSLLNGALALTVGSSGGSPVEIITADDHLFLWSFGNIEITPLASGAVVVGVGGGGVGFYGSTGASKPTVSGSRGSNAALASLLTALASLNLITNSTS